jgi:acyl-CoA thioester hydrolase
MPVSQTRIRVRYAETDQMGVVYYANFFIWFEVGRVELCASSASITNRWRSTTIATSRSSKPIAATNLQRVTTTSCCSRPASSRCAVRSSSSAIACCAPRTAKTPTTLLAEGETTHVTVDRSMRKVPLPEKYVAVLEQFVPAPS